ncbi:hypothetical protein KK062_29525 [Fulvivirgaceae bacterium PWU5]|uniref:Uncharacterized protein n=1 Tax=Dawidia cretensis TaxID=2782350 RepID=A0AAP2E4Z3_9BACT|nr:hypothetical protein [Dawidia cretensis]MBT1712419.1 hypothetical protein [Dawidia cretensis]
MRTFLDELRTSDETVPEGVDAAWHEAQIARLMSLRQRKDELFDELAVVVEELNAAYKMASRRLAHDNRRVRHSRTAEDVREL